MTDQPDTATVAAPPLPHGVRDGRAQLLVQRVNYGADPGGLRLTMATANLDGTFAATEDALTIVDVEQDDAPALAAAILRAAGCTEYAVQHLGEDETDLDAHPVTLADGSELDEAGAEQLAGEVLATSGRERGPLEEPEHRATALRFLREAAAPELDPSRRSAEVLTGGALVHAQLAVAAELAEHNARERARDAQAERQSARVSAKVRELAEQGSQPQTTYVLARTRIAADDWARQHGYAGGHSREWVIDPTWQYLRGRYASIARIVLVDLEVEQLGAETRTQVELMATMGASVETVRTR